jgi:excisionase family DNA binding protein
MDEPAEDKGLLTLEEATAFLRVSRSTMYRLIKRRELPGYKIARRWMFDRSDLRQFVASRRTEQVLEHEGTHSPPVQT